MARAISRPSCQTDMTTCISLHTILLKRMLRPTMFTTDLKTVSCAQSHNLFLSNNIFSEFMKITDCSRQKVCGNTGKAKFGNNKQSCTKVWRYRFLWVVFCFWVYLWKGFIYGYMCNYTSSLKVSCKNKCMIQKHVWMLESTLLQYLGGVSWLGILKCLYFVLVFLWNLHFLPYLKTQYCPNSKKSILA